GPHPLVEVSGVVLDLRIPLERRHRQHAVAARGRCAAGAQRREGLTSYGRAQGLEDGHRFLPELYADMCSHLAYRRYENSRPQPGIRMSETRLILRSSKSPYNIATCQFPAARGLTAMRRRKKTFTSFVWGWRRDAVQAATG